MPPKTDTCDGVVLNYVNEKMVITACFAVQFFKYCYVLLIQQNRPLNSQNVADALQKFNLKKTAVQKSLDTLADGEKISFKEYGKQKIYLTRQDQYDIPNSEELARMKDANAELQQQLKEQKSAISDVEGEIKAMQSNLTLEEIHAKQAKLSALEELGIEYDEDVGVNLQTFIDLMQPNKSKTVRTH